MTDVLAKSRAMAAENQAAAELILAEPERYPGVMQEWARLVSTSSQGRNQEGGLAKGVNSCYDTKHQIGG